MTYNKAVELSRRCAHKAPPLKALRTQCLRGPFVEKRPFLAEVPGEVRDAALRDFDKAIRAERAKARRARAEKKKKGPHKPATFQFRSRRDALQCIEIRHRDWNRSRGMFAALFSPTAMRSSEPLPDVMEAAFRVTLNRLGVIHICYPVRVEPVWAVAGGQGGDSQAPVSYPADKDGKHVIRQPQRSAGDHSVMALDPGVRTFMTGYSADGLVVEWGAGDMKRIHALCRFADRLHGDKGVDRQKRRRLRRAWLRMLERVRNLVDEVHRKLAKWLVTSYRVVLLPEFETARMCRRGVRGIGSKVVRGMLTWAHYRFRQALLAKAELYPDCRVVVCDEAYTSKTCGQCGEINHKLGGSKVFRCRPCGYTASRDVSAARNILLRYLTLHGIPCL